MAGHPTEISSPGYVANTHQVVPPRLLSIHQKFSIAQMAIGAVCTVVLMFGALINPVIGQRGYVALPNFVFILAGMFGILAHRLRNLDLLIGCVVLNITAVVMVIGVFRVYAFVADIRVLVLSGWLKAEAYIIIIISVFELLLVIAYGVFTFIYRHQLAAEATLYEDRTHAEVPRQQQVYPSGGISNDAAQRTDEPRQNESA